jgi:hypothetical protein
MPPVPDSSSDQPNQTLGISPFYQSQARVPGEQGSTRQSKKKGKNAPGREEASAKDTGKAMPNNVLVYDGFGFGFTLSKVCQQTENTNVLLILEPNPRPRFEQGPSVARFLLPSHLRISK